jgi:hypothetical protein
MMVQMATRQARAVVKRSSSTAMEMRAKADTTTPVM